MSQMRQPERTSHEYLAHMETLYSQMKIAQERVNEGGQIRFVRKYPDLPGKFGPEAIEYIERVRGAGLGAAGASGVDARGEGDQGRGDGPNRQSRDEQRTRGQQSTDNQAGHEEGSRGNDWEAQYGSFAWFIELKVIHASGDNVADYIKWYSDWKNTLGIPPNVLAGVFNRIFVAQRTPPPPPPPPPPRQPTSEPRPAPEPRQAPEAAAPVDRVGVVLGNIGNHVFEIVATPEGDYRVDINRLPSRNDSLNRARAIVNASRMEDYPDFDIESMSPEDVFEEAQWIYFRRVIGDETMALLVDLRAELASLPTPDMDLIATYRRELATRLIRLPANIPANVRRAIIAWTKLGTETRPVPEVVKRMELDVCRKQFMDRMQQSLFTSTGKMDMPTQDSINLIIKEFEDKGAPTTFRTEATALAKMMIASRAVVMMRTKMDVWSKIHAGAPTDHFYDSAWVTVARDTPQDETLLAILRAPESEMFHKVNVSKAWKRFRDMAVRVTAKDAGGKFLLQDETILPEDGKGYQSGLGENYTSFVNDQIEYAQRELGISEYEARMGWLMYESLNAAEYDKKHFAFGLTHPKDNAEGYRFSPIWWGSKWVFRKAAVMGVIDGRHGGKIDFARAQVGQKGDNAMPDRIWTPPGERVRKLREAITSGSGTEFLNEMLDMAYADRKGSDVSVILGELYAAQKLSEAITNIKGSVARGELGANKLWAIREMVTGLVVNGNLSSEKACEALAKVTRVMLLELSIFDDQGASQDGNGIRARNPIQLWEICAGIASFSDVDQKQFFDLSDKLLKRKAAIMGSPGQAGDLAKARSTRNNLLADKLSDDLARIERDLSYFVDGSSRPSREVERALDGVGNFAQQLSNAYEKSNDGRGIIRGLTEKNDRMAKLLEYVSKNFPKGVENFSERRQKLARSAEGTLAGIGRSYNDKVDGWNDFLSKFGL